MTRRPTGAGPFGQAGVRPSGTIGREPGILERVGKPPVCRVGFFGDPAADLLQIVLGVSAIVLLGWLLSLFL